MMKIIKLLLIGILSVTSNPQVANNQNVAKNSTFHQISRTIAANARITVGLNALSLFVQPSLDQEYVFREAMSLFFNFNRSVIDGFAIINEEHAESVLKTIGNMKTSGIKVDEPLKNIQAMEKIIENVNELPPISRATRNEILPALDELKVFGTFDFSVIDEFLKAPNEILSYDPLNSASNNTPKIIESAAVSLKQLPIAIQTLINTIHFMDNLIKIVYIFEAIDKRKKIYESVTQGQITSISSLNVDTKFFETANSLRIAAKAANSLDTISQSIGKSTIVFSNQFSDMTVLKTDYKDPDFLDVLNEEANSTVLEMIMSPVVNVSTALKPYWDEIERIFGKDEMKTATRDLNSLLTHLMDAVPPGTVFQSSLNSIGELTGEISGISFKKEYENKLSSFDDTINKYKTFETDFKQFLDSDDYKNMVVSDELIKTVEGGSLDTLKTNEQLKKTVEKFKDIRTKLETQTGQLTEIIENLKGINWKELSRQVDYWIQDQFEPFTKALEEKKEAMKRVRSGFNFIKQLQSASFPNLESNIGELEETMKKMKEEVGKMNEELKVKMDPSDKQEPFYKYMIHLRYEYYHLKDQLASGAYLFKLFDRFLENINAFDKFLDEGVKLYQKLKTSNSADAAKMKTFDSMKEKVVELKKQMEIRKKRYDGRPMKPLFKLRWLIENLQNVPNPELRIQELKEIADDIGSDASEFKTSLDGIFDLDFGFHQQIINGTFANYRGLVRYNHLILKITAIQDRTFFEWYYPYIEIAKFMGISILANVLLYAGAIYKMRYDERQEKIREKELRDEYFEWRMQEINQRNGFEKEE